MRHPVVCKILWIWDNVSLGCPKIESIEFFVENQYIDIWFSSVSRKGCPLQFDPKCCKIGSLCSKIDIIPSFVDEYKLKTIGIFYLNNMTKEFQFHTSHLDVPKNPTSHFWVKFLLLKIMMGLGSCRGTYVIGLRFTATMKIF